jgi:hypothetical protein
MTFSDCWVTVTSLTEFDDPGNPAPFRKRLPPSRNGHYWAPAVEGFARANGLEINWVLDNGTPEIVVNGAQLQDLFLDAFGENDPYYALALPYLVADQWYRVYADDF